MAMSRLIHSGAVLQPAFWPSPAALASTRASCFSLSTSASWSFDATPCRFGSSTLMIRHSSQIPYCKAFLDKDKKSSPTPTSSSTDAQESDTFPRLALRSSLWLLAGAYVFWLFILPYAPGDPVWAIKPDTITMLLDLSHNFFYVLPVANLLGFHLLESPTVNPTAEALFNLVMGWTVMFAPLLFTDKRRNRFNGSLAILWGIQMFLTNTVLIPYMAIRLNKDTRINESEDSRSVKINLSGVEDVLTSGTKVVSVICGVIGLVSVSWFFIGRPDEGFGSSSDRWSFFLEYLASDRVGYAFIWDICLYSLFQPWLIGENLENIAKDKAGIVGTLRFIPYVGLVAYLWGLERSDGV